MPAKKAGKAKKQLVRGKKSQEIKPLMQGIHITRPVDVPSPKIG